MTIQVLILDAMADAAGLMEILSRVADAERAAELQREREAAEAQARMARSPVAYIVVRGSKTSEAAPPEDDKVPPSVPQAVAATAVTDASVEVTWEESEDDHAVLGYEVVREGTSPFTTNEARFRESNLGGGTSYCYRVIAMDAAGNRSAQSEPACATTQDILPPTVPGRVVATVQPPNTVILQWPESVDDSGRLSYQVFDNGALLAATDGTSWTHAGAEPDVHRYTVRAVDGAGNRSVAAEPTRVALGDLEPPSPPADLELTPVSPTQIALQWTASSDNTAVVQYEVVSRDKVVARSGTTGATTFPLTEWEEHCFAVRAVDAAGNRSEPSARACGRTLDAAAWKAWRQAGSRSARR